MHFRKRILIVGPTPPPYHGVAVAIQTLLESSIAERFQLSHLDLADRRGIEHVNKPDLYDVLLFCRQWAAFVLRLMRSRPRLTYLVLSQSTIGFLRDSFLVWPAYLFGSRVVLHLHGGNFRQWFTSRSWFMKAYVKAVLKRVTRTIVLGQALKDQFSGLVSEQAIVAVSNGVDLVHATLPARIRGTEARCQILHLSTLSHLKGALVLLEAVPLVIAHDSNVEFVFSGPWSHQADKAWAALFIAQHNIAEYVQFTGEVDRDQKGRLFESAEIFVFPGVQQEGQPLVVLEAMAAGLPVIFTERGCLKETVVDGESGLCVKTNDVEDLARAILWLLTHPEQKQAMGRAAKTRQQDLFTRDKHIAAMIQVFESAAV